MVSILLAAACSQIPDEIRHPRPLDVLLRMSIPVDSTSRMVTHRGTLLFADADSVVLSDRGAGRVTLRPDSGTIMEIYRGQKVTGGSIARGAVRGGLLGLASGAVLRSGDRRLLQGSRR